MSFFVIAAAWLRSRLSEASTWSSISTGTAAIGLSLQHGMPLPYAVAAGVFAAAGFAIPEGK